MHSSCPQAACEACRTHDVSRAEHRVGFWIPPSTAKTDRDRTVGQRPTLPYIIPSSPPPLPKEIVKVAEAESEPICSDSPVSIMTPSNHRKRRTDVSEDYPKGQRSKSKTKSSSRSASNINGSERVMEEAVTSQDPEESANFDNS